MTVLHSRIKKAKGSSWPINNKKRRKLRLSFSSKDFWAVAKSKTNLVVNDKNGNNSINNDNNDDLLSLVFTSMVKKVTWLGWVRIRNCSSLIEQLFERNNLGLIVFRDFLFSNLLERNFGFRRKMTKYQLRSLTSSDVKRSQQWYLPA